MTEYRAPKSGIFIIAPIGGAIGARIEELQRTHDPRILKLGKPHITLIGSSGAGPVSARTPVAELRERLEPIANSTAPLRLILQPPMKFMQTEIVVLPLDPNGPVRTLHERLKGSGLPYAKPRFYFTPHVTLSLYRELPKPALATLLTQRFTDPVEISSIECHLTTDTGDSAHLLTLRLTGAV